MAQARLATVAALALAGLSLGAPPAAAAQDCVELGTAWVCTILDPAGLPSPSIAGRCDAGISLRSGGTDVSLCVTSASDGGPLVSPPSVGMPGVTLPDAPRASACSEGYGLQFSGGVLLGHVCLLIYYGPPEGAPAIDPRTCSAWINGDIQRDRMVLCPRLAGDVDVPSAVDVIPPTIGEPSSPGDPGASGCSEGFGAGASVGGTRWTLCAEAVVDIQPIGEPDARLCEPGQVGLVVTLGDGAFGLCANL